MYNDEEKRAAGESSLRLAHVDRVSTAMNLTNRGFSQATYRTNRHFYRAAELGETKYIDYGSYDAYGPFQIQ